jgi:hypothetical protein
MEQSRGDCYSRSDGCGSRRRLQYQQQRNALELEKRKFEWITISEAIKEDADFRQTRAKIELLITMGLVRDPNGRVRKVLREMESHGPPVELVRITRGDHP